MYNPYNNLDTVSIIWNNNKYIDKPPESVTYPEFSNIACKIESIADNNINIVNNITPRYFFLFNNSLSEVIEKLQMTIISTQSYITQLEHNILLIGTNFLFLISIIITLKNINYYINYI